MDEAVTREINYINVTSSDHRRGGSAPENDYREREIAALINMRISIEQISY